MVVLDTHAWIWWVADPARLSERAQEAIANSESVGVAAISCWEVAMLALRDRIKLDRSSSQWVRQALAQPGVTSLALNPKAAVEAALLAERGFDGDPADQLIYATARDAGAPLVTRDARLREFDPRLTLW